MVVFWMLWIVLISRSSNADNTLVSTTLEVHNPKLIHPTTTPATLQELTSIDIVKPARDKRGTGEQLQDDGTTSVQNVNEINEIHKRSPVNYMDGPRMRFSSWAGKRAKFSSWGGKRGDQGLTESNEDDILDEKRAKFSSWAGKRSGEQDELNWVANRADDLNDFGRSEDKRAKFSSWAGKRDEDKRKFSSWAGKRYDENNADFNDIIEDKRARFNSWAGKRAKFNSWGGKRSNNEDGNEYEENIVEDKKNLPWNNYDQLRNDKRAKFSSWGGKRGEDWWTGKRARFNSWGGKRSVNTTTDNNGKTIDDEDGIFKRSPVAYTPLSWKRKPIFSSWGGKRTARSAQLQRRLILPSNLIREHSSWGTLLRPIRRGPDFYAWGGKRST